MFIDIRIELKDHGTKNWVSGLVSDYKKNREEVVNRGIAIMCAIEKAAQQAGVMHARFSDTPAEVKRKWSDRTDWTLFLSEAYKIINDENIPFQKGRECHDALLALQSKQSDNYIKLKDLIYKFSSKQ